MSSKRIYPGQAAFEAARRSSLLFCGEDLNPWDGLDPKVQAGWEEVAKAAIEAQFIKGPCPFVGCEQPYALHREPCEPYHCPECNGPCQGHLACTHPPGSGRCEVCMLLPGDTTSAQAAAKR